MLSVRIGVMVGFLPVATVGFIPTVFVGWVVGLVCGWSGLFEIFASVVCASVLGFKIFLMIIFIVLNSLGAYWITFVVASGVFIMTLKIVGDSLYQY